MMKNIINIITLKFKYSGIALFALVCVGSCTDLEERPEEVFLAPGKYSELFEFRAGVTGVYDELAKAATLTAFYNFAFSGDDITTHRESNKEDFREFDQLKVTAINNRIDEIWEKSYRTIFLANNVLASIEGVDLGVTPAELAEQNRLTGEMYFIRAMLHHHLTRMFKKIPIKTTSENELEIKASGRLEVYTQIESDLNQAMGLLPEIYPGVEAGAPRPNSGSAKALLARVYMDWAGFPVKDASKYGVAAQLAGEVIRDKNTHGFNLINNLEDLWKVDNRFNSEGVWTIAFCQPCQNGNGKFGIQGGPSDTPGGGWQETLAEIKFFEDFPQGARKEATYRTDLNWAASTDQANPSFKKIKGPIGDFADGTFATSRNDFYIRFADVLLMYAEASGESGTTVSGVDPWEALNQVRRRAAGLPFGVAVTSPIDQLNADGTPNALEYVDITSGDLADLAFVERKWELAGEWLRWSDLVRKEKVAEALAPALRNSGSIPEWNQVLGNTAPSVDNYFAPIPTNQITNLPSLGQ